MMIFIFGATAPLRFNQQSVSGIILNCYVCFLFTDLTDNLVLEKTLCDLRKELDQSHEKERRLQSKTEEFETLSVKVDELQRQVRGAASHHLY